jgi:transposase-like protein
MQIHHVGYRIRGFYRVAALGHLWGMTPKDAHRRLEILRFFDKHGLAATRDAFGVSRRTLYRWKATLKAQGGNPAALAAQSSAPKRRRTPNTDPRLVSEIRRLRTLHPNLGKAKLHVLLAPWCAQHGIALPSVSTIGRIIARAPDKMRHAPARIDSRGKAQAPAAAPDAQKTQAGQGPSPGGAGLRHHRAHPRRHAPLYRHLHRSGLALCLCRGATLQARPIHRPRP